MDFSRLQLRPCGSFVVARQAVRGFADDARDAKVPAQTEKAVPIAGAIGQAELRLKAVSAGRNGDRHREVAGAGVKIRRKLFAYA